MIGKVQDVVSAAVVISAANAAQSSTEQQNRQSVDSQNAMSAENAQGQISGTETQNKIVQGADGKQDMSQDNDQQGNQQGKMNEESVSLMTEELNKLMSKINCDLEFQYHKEVNMMSVKMLDKNTKEVLKEYPPEEMIKGMIEAREWIGAFLDKTV
jgi:flagellar protein FlaG